MVLFIIEITLVFSISPLFSEFFGADVTDMIRRVIEAVITSCTRNAVVLYRARGFESHTLRQKATPASSLWAFLIFLLFQGDLPHLANIVYFLPPHSAKVIQTLKNRPAHLSWISRSKNTVLYKSVSCLSRHKIQPAQIYSTQITRYHGAIHSGQGGDVRGGGGCA